MKHRPTAIGPVKLGPNDVRIPLRPTSDPRHLPSGFETKNRRFQRLGRTHGIEVFA